MSLARIKRKLQIGDAVEMVHHGFAKDGKPGPKVTGIRRVTRVQTNGVQFEGGSWLFFPKASETRETPNGFEIALVPDFSKVMRYEWR